MSTDAPVSSTYSAPDTHDSSRLGGLALLVAGIPFFAGGVIVTLTDVPPSGSPVLGMISHILWALGIALLALGVVAHLRSWPSLRRGLAGYLAAGVLGLGVLQGLQWVTWAYVDVRGARESNQEAVLETIIAPYGAGHLVAYGLLLGAGIAFLGWALRWTDRTSSAVAWSGVVLGALTAGLWTVIFVVAMGGGEDGHILFDITTLLLPVLYLWAMVLGGSVVRSGDSA